MLVLEGDTVLQKALSFIRLLLPLQRFDLFLQGTLLVLTLYDGYAYLLLRRSAKAGLLSPTVEDSVFMWAAAAEFVLGAYVAWVGRNLRQYNLAAWLLSAAVAGLIVLAFPQPDVDIPLVQLCDAPTSVIPDTLNQIGSWSGTTLTIITAILCSLARLSIWAHGITYLDDHDPANAVYFYGILVSIRVSVGVNARNWFEGLSLGDDWWKPQLSLAILTLMFAVLFALFPKRIKGWPLPSLDKMSKKESEFLSTVKRLLKNKALMVQTVGLGLINAGVWGFIMNEKDYTQTRYHYEAAPDWSDGRNSRVVGDILRTFVIVFFVAVFRARFSGRRPEGAKATTLTKVGGVVAVIAAAFFTVIAVLRCDNGAVAGLGERYTQPDCSSQCGCSSEQYGFAPVCVLDSLTTYFSPCHAGCSDSEDLNGLMILYNCTCSGGTARAVQGGCDVIGCQFIFSIYQILYVNALAVSAASILMQGMVVLRAARPADKPAAIGLAFGVAALIAHVLGHLLYIAITEATCVYKDGARCLWHSASLPAALGGATAALALCSAGLSFASFFLSRREERRCRQLAS